MTDPTDEEEGNEARLDRISGKLDVLLARLEGVAEVHSPAPVPLAVFGRPIEWYENPAASMSAGE